VDSALYVTASDDLEARTHEGGAFCLSFVVNWVLYLAMVSACRKLTHPEIVTDN